MVQYTVPMIRQERVEVLNTCWFASLLMLLRYHGIDQFGTDDARATAEKVGDHTAERWKSNVPVSLSELYGVRAEVNNALGKKLKYIKLVNYDGLDGQTLEQYLKQHGPLVCGGLFAMNPNRGDDYNTGHYVVLSGYDNGTVYYNDPLGRESDMAFKEFKSLLFCSSINFKRVSKEARVSIHEGRYNFMYCQH